MSPRTQNLLSLAVLAVALVIASLPAKSQTMTTRARGEFDVKLLPLADEKGDRGGVGRMSIDKQFRGDLQGKSEGSMMTAMGDVKGSAGYVAIERVSAILGGRNGTFMLQHSGTMTRGAPQLTITVVPDTGTDQLAGIAGKMAIKIEGGKHFYDFEYTLADSPKIP